MVGLSIQLAYQDATSKEFLCTLTLLAPTCMLHSIASHTLNPRSSDYTIPN